MNTIKVDKERVIGKINRDIFGGLIEHYNKTIYGGIVDYNNSKADRNGFRSDVLDAFTKINTSVLRWPGGNFASGYHWEDGVGPVDERPVRYDLEWQVEESNRFGTDEFIKFCRKIKAEPYICVNAGSGTAEEAAHWVEYCNLKGNSYYAKLREKNGNAEPYGVKYWGIGNELYGRGQIGRKDIGQYIDCVKEYSKLMKKVDPTIKLIAVGLEKTEWNFRLVKEAGEYFDYISVHSYHIGQSPKSYKEIAALSFLTSEQLYEMQCSIDAASYYIKDRKRRPIEIAFDEWNLREWSHEKFIEWLTLAYDYNTENRELRGKNSVLVGKEGIESRDEMIDFFTQKRLNDNDDSAVTMADAIYTACVFNSVLRMCNRVTMCTFSPIINGKGLFSSLNDTIINRPTYYAFQLYSNYMGETALDTYVDASMNSVYIDSPVYNTNKNYNVPLIDAIASYSADRKKLYLAVINRNEEKSEKCTVKLDNFSVKAAGIHEICSNGTESSNSVSHNNEVYLRDSGLNIDGNIFIYDFLPHSISILELDVD
jgi:alpha-N-arabinofuranosidase